MKGIGENDRDRIDGPDLRHKKGEGRRGGLRIATQGRMSQGLQRIGKLHRL